ncbi:hypothetical protein NDU88_001294 [Pleurodeles waltl]|uniref:Uncharacterized protein n=1 Tax=Pleurodeles waltl TaxID=8319 RepID=A0AAV7LCC4_PLEWA|nr:hypothetical protein NDU88_001294 [Pleurodeles waltl]
MDIWRPLGLERVRPRYTARRTEVRPERDWRPSPRGVLRAARQRWDATRREAVGPLVESLLEQGEKPRG